MYKRKTFKVLNGGVNLETIEFKKDLDKLVNRYYRRECEDEDIGMYAKVSMSLQDIIFRYEDYIEDFTVYKTEDTFLVAVKDSEYEFGVKMVLSHKNVENINYSVSSVLIRGVNCETLIEAKDGYIAVSSLVINQESAV